MSVEKTVNNAFDCLDFALDDLQDLQEDIINPLSLSSFGDFSELCIPDDSLDDIGWLLPAESETYSSSYETGSYVDFPVKTESESYSSSYETGSYVDSPTTPEQEIELKRGNKRGFVEDLHVNWSMKKKQRSKRSGGRVWSSNVSHLLPLKRCCTHCGIDNTPQWRQGPLGPKTLCNACGVRYKSGRLVPEYRPAASPTFDHRKHSNSHKKIVRMRMSTEDM
ncbi:hypothetical protein ACHQM5_016532 [Ranunculus cassubicifolius]